MSQSVRELTDLPDELLGASLGRLPLSEGPTVTLVCKRFRRLFYQQPRLWRRFEVVVPLPLPDDFDFFEFIKAKHALLQRVAPVVQHYRLIGLIPNGWCCGDWHGSLEDFLQPLPPSLTALEVQRGAGWLPETVELLHQFTGLRSLSLGGHAHAAALLTALQRMPQLAQLQCGVFSCPEGLASSLAQLRSLTALELTVSGHLPLLQPLTGLSALRHLHLFHRVEHAVAGPLVPPTPAAFPALEGFLFRTSLQEDRIELGGVRCHSCNLQRTLAGDKTINCLAVVFAQPPELFAPLLTAAVPPSVTLQALQLASAQLSAQALRGCTQLASLRLLELRQCYCDEAAAAALLGTCPQLALLTLNVRSPQHLLSQPWPQLRALRLAGVHELPPELAQQTGLTDLAVWLPTVTERDVELASRMTHLRRLRLS